MGAKLIPLSFKERARCNKLIKKECTNYFEGNCLLLDDGDEHVCPQSISYSLRCRYFTNCVLPADEKLQAEICGKNLGVCEICKRGFIRKSNRQKYCPECSKKVLRKKKTSWQSDKRRGSLGC